MTSGDDPGLMLLTAAMERFGMTFAPDDAILELGCAESDWLEQMCADGFNVVGADTRPQRRSGVVQGNAMDPALFPLEWFDWIVLIGALEHFGLGAYGDPKAEGGDSETMRNVVRWLKPGGFVYFDVPCQPTTGVSADGLWRYYSPADVGPRLIVDGLREIHRGYSFPEPRAGTWVPEPTEPRIPYWYVALLAQKKDSL